MSYGTYVNAQDNLKDKYIVWSPGASMPPKMTYPDMATAIKVAYVMANKEPLHQFAVCKITGVAKLATVKFESFEDKETAS